MKAELLILWKPTKAQILDCIKGSQGVKTIVIQKLVERYKPEGQIMDEGYVRAVCRTPSSSNQMGDGELVQALEDELEIVEDKALAALSKALDLKKDATGKTIKEPEEWAVKEGLKMRADRKRSEKSEVNMADVFSQLKDAVLDKADSIRSEMQAQSIDGEIVN